MRSLALVLVVVVVGGCAVATEDSIDDSEAESAAVQDVTGTFVGLYRTHATALKDGDLPSLELQAAGTYVRARCYHAGCAINAPETDRYEVYTSSAGRTYLRFYGVKVTFDAAAGVTSKPVVADVYEVKAFSHGIMVRKASTARWQSLFSSSPSLQCHSSGGAWSLDTCTCPGNVPNTYPAHIFISGAGGCIATPGANESNCDASHGQWTDDEATAVGSYCVCGTGRYLTSTGACAAL